MTSRVTSRSRADSPYTCAMSSATSGSRAALISTATRWPSSSTEASIRSQPPERFGSRTLASPSSSPEAARGPGCHARDGHRDGVRIDRRVEEFAKPVSG